MRQAAAITAARKAMTDAFVSRLGQGRPDNAGQAQATPCRRDEQRCAAGNMKRRSAVTFPLFAHRLLARIEPFAQLFERGCFGAHHKQRALCIGSFGYDLAA